MSSKEISFAEKQALVQDSLIEIINSSVCSPIIRFWKPEERTMTEDEMENQFTIYNGFTFITHYSKRSRKTEFKVRMGKNFSDCFFDVDLEPDVYRRVKTWIRSASIALDRYFTSRYDGIYIGRLRYDFLTEDKKTFFIPDFRLETNIFFYRDLLSSNSSHFTDYPETDTPRIPVEEFVNSEWDDIMAERNFREQINKSK